MLDADERVPAELAGEIEQLQPARDVAGYSVPRRNHFCGRWIRSGGWWPDRLVRLIRTGQATLQGRGAADAVHETWQPKGICVALQSPIDHYSYGTITAYRRKFALYTALESKGRHGTLLGVIGAWLLVPVRFAWFWFRRGGIFEGWQGAYVCAGNAMYPAVVMMKSWSTAAPPQRGEQR
jgi:hypothetical protein